MPTATSQKKTHQNKKTPSKEKVKKTTKKKTEKTKEKPLKSVAKKSTKKTVVAKPKPPVRPNTQNVQQKRYIAVAPQTRTPLVSSLRGIVPSVTGTTIAMPIPSNVIKDVDNVARNASNVMIPEVKIEPVSTRNKKTPTAPYFSVIPDENAMEGIEVKQPVIDLTKDGVNPNTGPEPDDEQMNTENPNELNQGPDGMVGSGQRKISPQDLRSQATLINANARLKDIQNQQQLLELKQQKFAKQQEEINKQKKQNQQQFAAVKMNEIMGAKIKAFDDWLFNVKHQKYEERRKADQVTDELQQQAFIALKAREIKKADKKLEELVEKEKKIKEQEQEIQEREIKLQQNKQFFDNDLVQSEENKTKESLKYLELQDNLNKQLLMLDVQKSAMEKHFEESENFFNERQKKFAAQQEEFNQKENLFNARKSEFENSFQDFKNVQDRFKRENTETQGRLNILKQKAFLRERARKESERKRQLPSDQEMTYKESSNKVVVYDQKQEEINEPLNKVSIYQPNQFFPTIPDDLINKNIVAFNMIPAQYLQNPLRGKRIQPLTGSVPVSSAKLQKNEGSDEDESDENKHSGVREFYSAERHYTVIEPDDIKGELIKIG